MNALQAWTKEQERQQLEQEARNKPRFFNDFNEYAITYPEVEKLRRIYGSKECFVATYADQSCLPGDYYAVFINQWHEVVVNDGDDGYVRKKCKDLQEAKLEVESLKKLAPFHYGELKEFGYQNG